MADLFKKCSDYTHPEVDEALDIIASVFRTEAAL